MQKVASTVTVLTSRFTQAKPQEVLGYDKITQ